MLVQAPKPAMKYQPVDVDENRDREYVTVPSDGEASAEQTVRTAYLIAGGVCLLVGACLSAVSLGYKGRVSNLCGGDPSPTVYARLGGHHFHKEFCPYLRGVQLISRKRAVEEGYRECPLCRARPSNAEGQVCIRKGGGHFHGEGCLFLAKTRPLSRLQALAAGLKPCDRCGA